MQPLPSLILHGVTVVDQHGFRLRDPTDGSVVGRAAIAAKLVYALTTNSQSGLSRRYLPSHPPGESCLFGLDFSNVISPGVGIVAGTLDIFQNVVPPREATTDWTVGPLSVRDRALYATLAGGVDGTDYKLLWTAIDTVGNIWPRTGLVLVAATS